MPSWERAVPDMTTLLNMIATLDKPTSGDILLDGKSLVHLSDKEISQIS